MDGALERQALSEAVQVLAAMTVEGAVNLLGVSVLGEEVFYRSLERQPLREKLSQLLSTLGPGNEAVHSELHSLVMNLSQARNAFIHPKPQEGSPRDRQDRAPTLSNARQSVDETARVLALLQRLSYLYRPFFHVW